MSAIAEQGEWKTHCMACGKKLARPVYRRNFTAWVTCPREANLPDRPRTLPKRPATPIVAA